MHPPSHYLAYILASSVMRGDIGESPHLQRGVLAAYVIGWGL